MDIKMALKSGKSIYRKNWSNENWRIFYDRNGTLKGYGDSDIILKSQAKDYKLSYDEIIADDWLIEENDKTNTLIDLIEKEVPYWDNQKIVLDFITDHKDKLMKILLED